MSETAPLKLTNAQLAALSEGLASLDGLRTKPDEFKPYKFDDEQETMWLIADNIFAASVGTKRYHAARKILATQHGLGDGPVTLTKENALTIAAFMADLDKLDEREVEVPGLRKISRARLKVGTGEKRNPIPASVLAKLMPVLE